MKCEIGARSSQATILVIGRNPSDSRLLTNYLGKTKHEAWILADSFNIARRLFRKALFSPTQPRRAETRRSAARPQQAKRRSVLSVVR